MTAHVLHISKAVFICWAGTGGRGRGRGGANICIWLLLIKNETLKCYLASTQKPRRAKPYSFLDVVLYRASLRVLSRVWPYCSPWSSYGLPTQTPNCFVDVKYCMLPQSGGASGARNCCWDWQLHCVPE